jgi:hypothetical protein
MTKFDSLKLGADAAAGVTIGVNTMPESPETGSLIVTIVTILTRVVVEFFIERRRKKSQK